jgi:hypothetical protein
MRGGIILVIRVYLVDVAVCSKYSPIAVLNLWCIIADFAYLPKCVYHTPILEV